MSMVSAFDAAAMAKHKGAQMNLPAAATEDEHAERSRGDRGEAGEALRHPHSV